MAHNIIDFHRLSPRFAGGDVKRFFDTHLTYGFGDLLLAAVGMTLLALLARFLYQRKIFLRI
jgi:hypothetical protein